jgi:hypothetical protein
LREPELGGELKGEREGQTARSLFSSQPKRARSLAATFTSFPLVHFGDGVMYRLQHHLAEPWIIPSFSVIGRWMLLVLRNKLARFEPV